MDALRLLCLLALSFYVADPIAGQSQKMLGEWSAQLADKYPKPLENDVKCKAESHPVKICDPNDVLDSTTKNEIHVELQSLEKNLTIRQIANCHPSGVFVVALLRSIVADAHDKGDETVKIAERFQQIWRLDNCSAVFVVSANDKACGLILGDVLKQLLPGLNTTSINTPSSICFAGNTFQGNITTLVQCLGTAFVKEIAKSLVPRTTTGPNGSKPKSPPSPDSTRRPEQENRSSSANDRPLIGNLLFVLVTLLLL